MDPLPVRKAVLLVVDAQRGFTDLCPAELPVPGGVEIVPAVNALLALPLARIDASQDWHPPDHCSLPRPARQPLSAALRRGTPGAEFLPGLHTERFHADLAQGLRPRLRGLRGHGPAPGFAGAPAGERHRGGGRSAASRRTSAASSPPATCAQAGFDVLLVEDASAGIDVPAAGLFQAKAKAEGQALGMEYVALTTLLASGVSNDPG